MNMKVKSVVLPSPVGEFSFPAGTPLVQSRLIRDTVQAQVMNYNKEHGIRVTDENSARRYMKATQGPCNKVLFQVVFN